MGIVVNALSIMIGSLLGSIFKERIKFIGFAILGISIMIISLVGFLENIFDVEEMTLKRSELIVVISALITGTIFWDIIQLETKIRNLLKLSNNGISGIVDATIFFGIGGMQICGPILLATMGDNSQLFIKSIIDFPFALMFGIGYGKKLYCPLYL